jgi:hypothetical protein
MLVAVRTLLIATVVLAVAGGIGLATTAALSPASDSAPLQPITVQTPAQRLPPSAPPAVPPSAPPPPALPAPAGRGPVQPDGVPAPPPPVTWSDDGDDDHGGDDDGDGGDDDADD